ncbi:MAG: MFS transporter, partial [Lacisediminimonas sp.]|nr:MFS transporter [Lacisediminimonas sp.]
MTPAPSTPAAPDEARTIRHAIYCLSLASFASGGSLRVTDSMLPRLADDFNITLGAASYAVTAFAIAYGVGQLLFGPLGDRFGKYLIIAFGCASGVLTTMLCAFAPNYEMLLLARFLAGTSAAAIIPLALAWIGDAVPYEQRQPVMARYLVGQIMGLSSGVLLGGLAADYFGWRMPFYVITVLYAIISVLLFTLNRRLPAHARLTKKSEGRVIPQMVSEFAQVLAKPWARVVLVTVFMEGTFVFGAFAFIASHLHHSFGLSLTAAGALVMLFGLGGLSFSLGSAKLVPRLGEIGLARWGGALVFASLLSIGLAPSWAWALPGCLVNGLGFYMLHNTLQINATQMAPERRGAAVSSFAFCFFLGQALGVALAAWVIAFTGTGAAIAGFGELLFAAALNF